MRLIDGDALIDEFQSKPYDSYATRIVVRMIRKAPTIRNEARLLTKADFHNGNQDGGEAIPCWKEARKPTRRSGWAVIVWGKVLADKGQARYWTTRPTDEQRAAAKWEEGCT